MKKLTIGRHNTCDIVIPDTSDLVSRKQAALVFSFWGKMTLYDTSNNGTYVNGTRIENGTGMRVTRKDKVNFARIADLDWKTVRNPYRTLRYVLIALFFVVAVGAGTMNWWLPLSNDNQESTSNLAQDESPESEINPSTDGEPLPVASPDSVNPQQPRNKRKSNVSKVKEKDDDMKEEAETNIVPDEEPQKTREEDKDVNNNMPLVY